MNLGLSILLALGGLTPADKGEAAVSALARLPVKEITVFKDGHAFVLHQGTMPVDASGNVVLDYLPTPVIGTFWPYSADKNAKLHSVVAGRRLVRLERTALTMRELIEANLGSEVLLTESGLTYRATIQSFLTRSAQELAATSPPNSGELLPIKSDLLVVKATESVAVGAGGEVKLAEGTRIVPLGHIQDVRFLGNLKTKAASEEHRNLLTMHLNWAGGKPEKTAEVGMAYLQKGVRWIPSYRVDLDGKGKATIKLEATLLNELTDLDKVTMHLVVGVPSFMFKDTTDPIALGQIVAQLSPHFDQNSQTAHGFSNAMMTQTARMQEVRQPVEAAPAEVNLGPDVAGSGKSEDLFIYTIKDVTLKKGQRLVLPVAEYTLEYKDVYTLELPFAPPTEARRQGGAPQQAELARLMAAPKLIHKVRLINKATQPLTTAPALLLREGRILAQGMMTYTPTGAASDLTVTTAVDVKVSRTEKETKRTPNAARWEQIALQRFDLTGTLSLTNHRAGPIEVEIVRYVLGNVNEAGQEGKAEMVNFLEDDAGLPDGLRPAWWGYYNWPSYWSRYNGIGKFTWKQKLEPGKSVDLTYSWNYIWP